MLAVIKGLELLKEPCEVTIYLSNQNLINTFESGWIERWIQKGWFAGPTEKIKNRDLLARMLELVRKHTVRFVRYDTQTLASPFQKKAKQLAALEGQKATLPEDVEEEPTYFPPLQAELEAEPEEIEYSEEELKEMQREKSARGAWHSRNIAEVTESFNNTCQHCGTNPPHKTGVAHHLSYPPDYWLIPTQQKIADGIITFLCRDCHQKAHTAATYEEYQQDKLKHSGHCRQCNAFTPKMWKHYSPTSFPIPLCKECIQALRDGRLVITGSVVPPERTA